jgi:HEPN domain-containing protein
MNDAVKEWVLKADGDFDAAGALSAAARPNYDAICFHAQQCVEKLMKAILLQRCVAPPHTHDLLKLDKLVRSVHAAWKCEKKDLRFLTHGSVAFRYPGESATFAHAATAMAICKRLRDGLLKFLHESGGAGT